MIIVDLIYNLTLLVALSVVSGFIDLRWSRNTRLGMLAQGALFGGTALIAMLRPLTLTPGLIFDGRSVVISLSGLFFGPWVAFLASAMTITLRIAMGGSGTVMGVLVILESALIGVFFHRLLQSRVHELRATQLWLFGMLVHLVMLALTFTLPNNAALSVLGRIGWPVILTYPLATVLIGKILSDQAGHSRFVADLKNSEERFRTVADFTYDWEYWAGPDKQIIYMSPSCERITGYRADEFQQNPGLLISIVHPDDRAAVVANLQTMTNAEGLGKAIDFRFSTRGGEERWISQRCQPVYGQTGAYLGHRVSNREISERKQAEEEIRKLNAELEQRVRERTLQLEMTNKELEAFSYSVSHDLRAPLRGIDGWSIALLEDYGSQLDQRAHQYLDRVRSETQRMGHLIDDMLQLSQLTRAEMRKEQVNLSEMAQSIATRLQELEPQRHVEFVIQAGLSATGDPRLLDATLSNLMGNAFKFTGKTATPRIEIGKIEIRGEPTFFVRDNGAGFDMAYSEKLFGAFQRMHKATEFPGTGIGLATVQRIVHRHGGRVWAEANVNQGATFYFNLG